MNEPAGCIFDLDGVIVNTAHYHFKAWQHLAQSLDIPFTEKDNEQLKGVSRRNSLLKILEMGHLTLSDAEMQRLMDGKNRQYQKHIANLDSDNILEGIPSFLDELESRNIPKAIGSSSKNTRSILKALDLTTRFGAIIDGFSVEHTKPHPEVFLKGADKLGVNPKKCIVFEDAASGIEAADRAGMISIGVGKNKNLNKANAVIFSFKDMTLHKIARILKN